MVYVFNNSNNDDVELTRNKDMREYAEKVSNYIDKPYSQIKKDFGNNNSEHFINRSKSSQFSLPTVETYNKLIKLYSIDKMDGFIKFDDLEFEKLPNTYNSQKTEGKPYKVKGSELKNKHVYGLTEIPTHENKTGQRHPKSVLTDIEITDDETPKTTIIKENYDKEKLHRTQKPVKLCEWLIKSYSNENDLILDFCMGSGSSIVACKNTNRNYIGIEMNKDIFEIAKKRIN
jgi:site-specific DNA-methyltransferase (adenine-specific)